MLKAVFIDYTGTMVREDEPYTRELVRYFASHSELKDPNEARNKASASQKTKSRKLRLKVTGIRFVKMMKKSTSSWNTVPGSMDYGEIFPTYMRSGTKSGHTLPCMMT